MAELYALCRPNAGALEVKRVALNQDVQLQLDGLFQVQEAAFLDDVDEEIPFDGDWKPDPNELLVADGLVEGHILLNAMAQNAVALPQVNPGNFEQEGIRGLFAAIPVGGQHRALIQNFSRQQLLTRRFSVLGVGNVFRRLNEPGFALGENLVGILTPDGRLKFKSFVMIRRIFDLAAMFQQATDADLAAFCGHDSLEVEDIGAFVALADEIIRKSVRRLAALSVLDLHAVADIEQQAQAMQFPLTTNAGVIVVPANRKEIKALLSFLLDRVYRGAFNGQLLITNSTRPL